MPVQKNILLIGDSFSASFGCFSRTFVDLFCQDGAYEEALTVHNASTFNVTSADALSYFDDFSSRGPVDLLVVALGNCDPCAYGYRKNAPLRKFPWAARRVDRKIKKSHPILKRNPPFTYKQHQVDGSELGGVVGVKDFKSNLKSLLAKAKQKDIPVVLFKLASNPAFPPCNNIGNRIFYKIFNLKTAHSYTTTSSEFSDVVLALQLHDNGEIDLARAAYEAMLLRKDERAIIATNNLAALHYEAGDFDAAEKLLGTLDPDTLLTGPILLYNKALLSMAQGKTEDSALFFAQAYQNDIGSYRIKPEYQAAIDSIATSGFELELIDLSQELTQEDFVDYCHPNAAAHQRISRLFKVAVERQLELTPGALNPSSTYVAYNPDLAMGYQEDFFTHVGAVTTPDINFSLEVLEEASKGYASALSALGKGCSSSRLNAQNAIIAHPLFGHQKFLQQIAPNAKVDQGRVPEFFFLRLMLPIYRALSLSKRSSKYAEVEGFIPAAGKVDTWFTSLRLTPSHLPSLERLQEVHGLMPWGEIFERGVQLAEQIVSSRCVAHSKVNSITYWFMREALLFGVVSDELMLSRRMDLLKLTDTLLFYDLLKGDDQDIDAAHANFRIILNNAIAISTQGATEEYERIFSNLGRTNF